MALVGKRNEQQEMWGTTTELPKSLGHAFYRKLNQLFADAGFDRFVAASCETQYARHKGRPGIPPGVYCWMLFGETLSD